MRYVHTNVIARDWEKLCAFYQDVLGCVPVGERRDLRGDWVDALTGIAGAHIVGQHLALPGHGEGGPTIEVFSYDAMEEGPGRIDATGFSHIAFAVDDVRAVAAKVVEAGGGLLGEVVKTRYADGRVATFVYAKDPEGNLIELQSWEEPA